MSQLVTAGFPFFFSLCGEPRRASTNANFLSALDTFRAHQIIFTSPNIFLLLHSLLPIATSLRSKGHGAASIFVSFKNFSESKNVMAVLPPYRRPQGFRSQPTARGLLFTLLLERIAAFIDDGDGGRRCTLTRARARQRGAIGLV